MSRIPRGLLSLASEAAAKTAFEHGMGALHIGAAVLDAVPDGWAKTDGGWAQHTDSNMVRDNYRHEVNMLFWDWVAEIELVTPKTVEDLHAFDVRVQQRALVLGIDIEKRDGEWEPAR